MRWRVRGDAAWLDADKAGTQHGDLNRGHEPMQVIVVELKNDKPKMAPADGNLDVSRSEEASQPATHTVLTLTNSRMPCAPSSRP